MKTNKKKSVVFPCIILIISLIIMIASGWYLGSYYYERYKNESDFGDLRDNLSDEAEVRNPVVRRDTLDDSNLGTVRHSKYDKMLEENPDFVGWIHVPGTVIDYPVMQTKNNEQKYLHLNFDGEWTDEGTPFCSANSDLARPSDNIIIYAHNMIYGSMFENLTKYEDYNFYNQHKKFYFDSIYRSGTYEIIGVVKTDINSGSYPYWNTTDCNAEEFYEYVNFIKKNSVHKIDAIKNVEYGDMLVTLSTCAYHAYNGRIIVIGKMIETDDENLT